MRIASLRNTRFHVSLLSTNHEENPSVRVYTTRNTLVKIPAQKHDSLVSRNRLQRQSRISFASGNSVYVEWTSKLNDAYAAYSANYIRMACIVIHHLPPASPRNIEFNPSISRSSVMLTINHLKNAFRDAQRRKNQSSKFNFTHLISCFSIVLRLMGSSPHQFMYRLDNFAQFIATYASIAVDIVQSERPSQSFIHRAAQ